MAKLGEEPSSGGSTTVKYPRQQSQLSCILTRHQPALFPSDDEPLPFMEYYATLAKNANLNVIIRDISDGEMFMEFDLLDAAPFIANSLRRCLLSDVPSMAPETVFMMQNTSIFSDDNIGSRLGLVPFRMDARRFKFRPMRQGVADRPEHCDFAAIFDLTINAIKAPPGPRASAKNAIRPANINVYSGDLKWVRHSSFPRNMPDVDIPRPVHDKILLATLLPAQELMVRVHVVKGIGKDHAKFSPVSTAFYRPIPEVKLLRRVHGEEGYQLQSSMPKGVIDIDENQDAVVADPRRYTTNRRVFTDSALSTAVQIAFRESDFLFNVESVGGLSSAVLVSEAIRILRDRFHYLHLICPKEPRFSSIKAEDNPHNFD